MSATQHAPETPIAVTGSGGEAAPRVVRWLGIAAAPIFALMGLWTALFRGHPAMLCMAMRDSSVMRGMTLMYLLMGVFHSAPWLKWFASRKSGAHRRDCLRSELRAHPMRSH